MKVLRKANTRLMEAREERRRKKRMILMTMRR